MGKLHVIRTAWRSGLVSLTSGAVVVDEDRESAEEK